MQVLQNAGVPVTGVREIEKSSAIALVMVTCEIPEACARRDDRFDVHVATVGTCKSLKGGRLYLAPLRGPFKGDPTLWGMAEGPIELDDTGIPTSGRVRLGAQILSDIRMEPPGDSFELVIQPSYVGWGTVAAVAQAINGEASLSGSPIASVIDDRSVQVTIPANERGQRANFLRDVLSATVNVTSMPATVIVNQRSGSIILTGNVTVSPVAITHKNLTITTTLPEPVPTPADPLIKRERVTSIQLPKGTPTEAAKLSELVAAMKQLDVPLVDQVDILQMLHKMGALKARLVVD
jgi:flagellar P-ring protein precursor FlgI